MEDSPALVCAAAIDLTQRSGLFVVAREPLGVNDFVEEVGEVIGGPGKVEAYEAVAVDLLLRHHWTVPVVGDVSAFDARQVDVKAHRPGTGLRLCHCLREVKRGERGQFARVTEKRCGTLVAECPGQGEGAAAQHAGKANKLRNHACVSGASQSV